MSDSTITVATDIIAKQLRNGNGSGSSSVTDDVSKPNINGGNGAAVPSSELPSVFGINDRSVKTSEKPLLKGSIPTGTTSGSFLNGKKATADDTERTMAISWSSSVPEGLDLTESVVAVLGVSGKRYSVELYSSDSTSNKYNDSDLIGVVGNNSALTLYRSYKAADGDPVGADLNGGTVQVFPAPEVEAASS